MKKEFVENLHELGASFDTETWLIRPKSVSPLVCGSVATKDGSSILDRDQCRDTFRKLLEPGVIYIGAFAAYDMIVMAHDAAKRGEDLLPAIFAKYRRREVYDILLAEMVDAIGRGTLGKSPDGGPMRKNGGKVTTRYSMEVVGDHVLGEYTKPNDFWRLRYYLLRNVPFDRWSDEMRQYLIDDVELPRRIALAQCGLAPRGNGRIRRAWNLHTLSKMALTSFALNLGATWGFAVDDDLLVDIEEETRAFIEGGRQPFIDAGMLKWNKGENRWSKDQSVIRTMVAMAFGGGDAGTCRACDGLKKVGNDKWDPAKPKKNLIQCKACSATGIHLEDAPSVPVSEKGHIQIGRDILIDSGDEELIAFGAWGEKDKIIQTYLPALKLGLPIKPNLPLANERVSYEGIVQTMPRGGRIRESIVARPDRYLASVDFAGVELCTVAQVCIWKLGYSTLADALNPSKQYPEGQDAHSILGADLIGVTYDEFVKRKKAGDKFVLDARQASKWGNFGYFGGMGVATFVRTNRKAPGMVTTAPDGTVYRGVRFCILIGGRPRCGEEKILEWKKRPTGAPLCKACCESASVIRDAWFGRWREARPYFKAVKIDVENQGWIRHYGSGMRRGGVYFTSAANGYFSSLAAVGATNAYNRVSEICYTDRSDPLYGSRPIAFVHDENVVSVPIIRSHDAAMRLGVVMVDEMQKVVPDVLIKAEPALMTKYFKGAEAVFVNDRLVPWHPKEKIA